MSKAILKLKFFLKSVSFKVNNKNNLLKISLILFILCGIYYLAFNDPVQNITNFYATKENKKTPGRILGNTARDSYKQKRTQFNKKIKKFSRDHKNLIKALERINKRLDQIEEAQKDTRSNSASSGQETSSDGNLGNEKRDGNNRLTDISYPQYRENVRFHPRNSHFKASGYDHHSSLVPEAKYQRPIRAKKSRQRRASYYSEREIINFPVKKVKLKEETIVLPAGSYVKGKLLTGVEVGSKALPVLAQLDYAHIIPSDKRIDLTGCFMLLKSSADLSTERIQMQGTTLSCVNKKDQFFERKINSFAVDDSDNRFGVEGELQSHQSRIAMLAFTNSVVERVSELIKGESRNNVASAGGVDAASMVAQWYLKYAQSLAPGLRVNSSKDAWFVMNESVQLPKKYFKRRIHAK